MRARLAVPIRPGRSLGLTILALNLTLFLLAFRDVSLVLAVGFMGLLGGPVGWAWSALTVGGWAAAPVCSGAVILRLWHRGQWNLRLQAAAIAATLVALSIRHMVREAIGF